MYVYNLFYFTYATASLVHLRKSLGPVISCCEALGNEQNLSYTPSHKTIFQRCILTHWHMALYKKNVTIIRNSRVLRYYNLY